MIFKVILHIYQVKRLIIGLILLILCTSQSAFSNQLLSDSLQYSATKQASQKTIDEILRIGYGYRLENLNLAIFYGNIALRKAESTGEQETIFQCYRYMGFYCEENNRLDKALDYYNKALGITEASGFHRLKLSILTDLAITHRKSGNYSKTLEYHTEALDLAIQEGNLASAEYSYNGLGLLYETIGDYEQAVEMYLKSLKVAEELNSQVGMITTMQNISMTYAKMSDLGTAQQQIKAAYELALKYSDSLQTADVLFDYGTILQKRKEYKEALDKYNKSMNVYKAVYNKPMMARSLIQIADCYTEKGDYENAQTYFIRSLDYKEYASSELSAGLHNKLGELYLKKGNHSGAKREYIKSLQIAEKHDYKELIQDNHHALYKIKANEGLFEEALSHLEKSARTKDYLLNEDKSKRITEMQFKFDAEKNENEIKELKFKQHTTVMIGSAAAFALFFLFLVYTIRTKGKNNKALATKNNEIQFQNIKLRESNEVLKNFAYVAAHDLKEPLRNIGSFINLIQKKYGVQFNDEANEYMSFVKNGVIRLNTLLTDLLEYSQISAQQPEKSKANIKATVDYISKQLKGMIDLHQVQIEVDNNLPELQMSQQHLAQVIENLITNSIKFNKQQPHIEIRFKRSVKQFAIISISDNGIGINEAFSHKVFNLFHRLDRQNNVEGTGIGLTICKNIVDKYDGDIWFESEEGIGTVFYIKLPLYSKTETIKENSLLPTNKFEEALMN